MGKPEGKLQLGKPRCRWEHNIEMNSREIEWRDGTDSSGSGERQVAGFCEHCNELTTFIKG
jgi:hypothetical protein